MDNVVCWFFYEHCWFFMNKIVVVLALFFLVLGLAAANVLLALPSQSKGNFGKSPVVQGSTAQVGVFVLPKQPAAENNG